MQSIVVSCLSHIHLQHEQNIKKMRALFRWSHLSLWSETMNKIHIHNYNVDKMIQMSVKNGILHVNFR